MTPEKLPRAGFLTGTSMKQKIMAVGLVIVILIIIWQVIGLFGPSRDHISPDEHTIKPSTMTAAGPSAATHPAPSGRPSAETAEQPEQPAVMREVTIPIDSQVAEMQKKTEQAYIDQLNQLQMLKVQKEIAETNQAIASARLATVTAEKNVSDLLTKPAVAPAQPEIPASAYAGSLTNPVQTGAVVVSPDEAVAPASAASSAPSYVVISVSMQLGQWSAVIGHEGKLYNVKVGDILPDDNSRVVSITKNGVVLEKEGKRKKFSLISSV